MTSQPAANPGSAFPAQGPALIYIVDDEPMLVDLAELILKGDGYRIKKFHAPEPALKSFLAESVLPALLVTDYVMGAMTGMDLAVQCKAKHPGLRILMLGGTVGPEILVGAPIRIDRFLAKPYQAQILREMVSGLLAE